jgi:hypothetical protein
MALFGVTASTNEGTRFFVIAVETAEQALSNINDRIGCPKENIAVSRFEDILYEQYGDFAELTTV